MKVRKEDLKKWLKDVKESNYFIEQSQGNLLIWLYKSVDCKRLRTFPFSFKEINKLGEFPAKYLVTHKKKVDEAPYWEQFQG